MKAAPKRREGASVKNMSNAFRSNTFASGSAIKPKTHSICDSVPAKRMTTAAQMHVHENSRVLLHASIARNVTRAPVVAFIAKGKRALKVN
jgi:hypothetical protein